MTKITEISKEVIEGVENQQAIFAALFYDCNEKKTAYVFADGHLLEIIFE